MANETPSDEVQRGDGQAEVSAEQFAEHWVRAKPGDPGARMFALTETDTKTGAVKYGQLRWYKPRKRPLKYPLGSVETSKALAMAAEDLRRWIVKYDEVLELLAERAGSEGLSLDKNLLEHLVFVLEEESRGIKKQRRQAKLFASVDHIVERAWIRSSE